MPELVLSLFPGIGLLDRAFEEEGFCVVRGPDLLWGGDIARFHPTAGRFDGVIGGPPCSAFSSAANVARAAGKAVASDLIPEFARVVTEAAPAWWLMENVPTAPPPFPEARAFRLDNRWVGGIQHRIRTFWTNLPLAVEVDLFEPLERRPTACTSVWQDRRQYGATTRDHLRQFVRDQGLPDDYELPAFTVRAAVRAVVSGVPLPLGRAIARAVVRAREAGPAAF